MHLARGVKFVHEVQERDGIGSARQRDDHARVRAEQPVLPNESPDAVEQQHGLERQVGLEGLEGGETADRGTRRWPALPPDLPDLPDPPESGAGGRTRTVDLALMRRPL